MKDLLFFDTMVTPKIIEVVYWLMLVGVVLGGLSTIFFVGKFIAGLIAIIVGALSARIFCELLIVIFKMNEALQDIRSKSGT